MAEHTGSSSLFAIFALSVFSLILIPYTLYRIFNSSEEATQPWLQGKHKKSALSNIINRYVTKGNMLLFGLWILWFLLLWYVQVTTKDLKPFDPYEILGIERGVTDKEIKRAYRQMSLLYHPDKNPDPKAHKFFSEKIIKAYEALTDETSRMNYEKYGHPDGPQGINIGVALPEWFFTKDKKTAPLMLLCLVGIGILLPLGIVSWYMLNSNRFAGPNRIMHETLALYFHSKYSVKESQSLVRIPETLVCAMEFITLPTTSEQEPALEELRKIVMQCQPDLKDKTAFWKRKASILKVHMLLIAYLEREPDIPAILAQDLKFLLTKTPILLEEMLKIALLPRPPFGFGWMTPSVAIIEMMQCVLQCVSLNSRKGGSKPADNMGALLQLPHLDVDAIKKLRRKKINSLKDFQDLSEEEITSTLLSAGLTTEQAEEARTFLMALPQVHASVTCEVDGEEEILERDIVRCKVRVILQRPSHKSGGFVVLPKGKSVRALTPRYDQPHEETWYFLLVDSNSNAVLAWTKASLSEAEAAAMERPGVVEEFVAAASSGDGKAETGKELALATSNKSLMPYGKGGNGKRPLEIENGDVGQTVDLLFGAHKAGKHELSLLVMCDSYIGVDKSVPVRMKVAPLSRAASEGRDARSLAKAQTWDSDEEKTAEDVAEDRSDKESDNEEEEEADDDDYDSDETGTEVSGDEDEEGEDGKEEEESD